MVGVKENYHFWDTESLKPYKSPGCDAVYCLYFCKKELGLSNSLILEQELLWESYHLFLAENENELYYKGWKEIYSVDPKFYRPISLTSFLLEAMEKMDIMDQTGLPSYKPFT